MDHQRCLERDSGTKETEEKPSPGLTRKINDQQKQIDEQMKGIGIVKI